MQYYKNILCVEGGWLYTEAKVMTFSTYKNLTYRGTVNVMRRASRNTPALIEYNSLPQKYRDIICKKYGDPLKTVGNFTFKSHLGPDLKAADFFGSEFTLPDGRYLSKDKQEEYCNNAMILNGIGVVVNDRTAMRKALGGSTRGIWKKIAETVNALKAEIKHSLPANHRRLKDRYEDYKQNGYIALVSRKFLNNNAAKVKEKDQEATIRQLLRKHNNLDNVQISDIYNTIAEPLKWEKISAGTIANYRDKWELETHTGRHGVTSFENNKGMQVKRKAPTYPLYYWTADGWDVELLYQEQTTDSNGNTRTTYHNRLNVVLILDPCCKYPIGYAVGTHESPALIRAAMRNAINHTRELFGRRHKVMQLQTDNYGKKSLLPVYKAISDYYTPARVKNAKAKVVEPYFNHINKKYCQLMPNWSGYNIASGSRKQPNAEWLNKIRHSFPDRAGVEAQIDHIINMERQAKAEEYLALYKEMPEEDKRYISDQDYLYHFGELTGFTNRLAGEGIVMTIDKHEVVYDSFDFRLRRMAGTDWAIKYDPEDLSTALAVNAKSRAGRLQEIIGTERIELTEKHIQPMALHEQSEEDRLHLKQSRDYNKSLKGEIMEQMSDDYDTVSELFRNNDKLEGTLAKLVLVDSAGQHKNNRSAARLQAADTVKQARKLTAKTERKEQKQVKQQESREADSYLDEKIDLSKYI